MLFTNQSKRDQARAIRITVALSFGHSEDCFHETMGLVTKKLLNDYGFDSYVEVNDLVKKVGVDTIHAMMQEYLANNGCGCIAWQKQRFERRKKNNK